MQSTLRIGLILTFIAGIMLIITSYIFGISFIGVAIPIILLYFGSGFVWPNAFAIAFTPFGHIAGYANSIYSFMQLCGGALLSTIMTILPTNTALLLAFTINIAALIALYCAI